MARDAHKQLERAEKILSDVQHRWAGIPDTLRSHIRDYFSEHERGMLIQDHVAPRKPVVLPRTKLQVLVDAIERPAPGYNMEHLLRCAIIQVIDEQAAQAAQREQASSDAEFSEY